MGDYSDKYTVSSPEHWDVPSVLELTLYLSDTSCLHLIYASHIYIVHLIAFVLVQTVYRRIFPIERSLTSLNLEAETLHGLLSL